MMNVTYVFKYMYSAQLCLPRSPFEVHYNLSTFKLISEKYEKHENLVSVM